MDYALIATAYDNQIRIYVSVTTKTVERIRQIHDTWPTASAALGRFLSISAMMGFMYKEDERISLKIEADGPIGNMVMETSGLGFIRGDIENPHVYLRYNDGKLKGKLDVKSAVGAGFIRVTKDLNMQNYFTSSSEIVSGEIAEDFTYYFTASEQTPSSVAAGVLVNPDMSILASGGFIIQVMPGCTDEIITLVENILKDFPPISSLINDGLTCERILSKLANNTENILSKKPIRYFCGCSKNKFKKALSTLDEKALQEIIDEDRQAEIICNFCHKKYTFDENDLNNILVSIKTDK